MVQFNTSRTSRAFAATVVSSCVALTALSHSCRADVPNYPGMPYDPVTDTGYTGAFYSKIRASDNGIAVTTLNPQNLGGTASNLATKYDPSGYSVLNGLSGGGPNVATWVEDINSTGVSVGSSQEYSAGNSLLGIAAVKWSSGGTITRLDGASLGTDPSGQYNYKATAISNNGYIGGIGTKYVGGVAQAYVGVRWDSSGNMSELNLPWGDAWDVYLQKINNSGMALASVQYSGGTAGVVWSPSGTPTQLQGIYVDQTGKQITYARDLNASGISTGFGYIFDGSNNLTNPNAVRWNANGDATILPCPWKDKNGQSFTSAYAINDSGQICGSALVFSNDGSTDEGLVPVRWEADNTMTIMEGSGYIATTAINSSGECVGFSDSSNLGLYWSADGALVSLDSLVGPDSKWIPEFARSISDSGWIAGVGFYFLDNTGSLGYDRPFLLNIHQSDAVIWKSHSSGNWSSASNWVLGTPSSSKQVVFDRTEDYTVNIDASSNAKSMWLRYGNVTLNPGSNQLQLDQDLIIANTSLTINGTLKAGTAATGQIGVGGKIQLRAGTLNVNSLDLSGNQNNFAWTSGANLHLNGGTIIGNISIPEPDLTNAIFSSFSGTGTIDGNLTVGWMLDMGNSNTLASFGVLRVNGNYISTSTSWLNMDFFGPNAGTDFDQLIITGNAALDSYLGISSSPDFWPTEGTFILIDAASLTGTFNGIADGDHIFLASGAEMILNYDRANGNVTLTAILPEPASLGLIGLAGMIALRRRSKI